MAMAGVEFIDPRFDRGQSFQNLAFEFVVHSNNCPENSGRIFRYRGTFARCHAAATAAHTPCLTAGND
jgi:hypothetical protein